MKSISLNAWGGTLKIDFFLNELGWSKCYLETGQRQIYLGAEGAIYIIEHLLTAFSPRDGRETYKLNNQDVQWVLTLSERYHSLYSTVETPETGLFWQDAEAKLVGTQTITTEQIENWRSSLEDMRTIAERLRVGI